MGYSLSSYLVLVVELSNLAAYASIHVSTVGLQIVNRICWGMLSYLTTEIKINLSIDGKVLAGYVFLTALATPVVYAQKIKFFAQVSKNMLLIYEPSFGPHYGA